MTTQACCSKSQDAPVLGLSYCALLVILSAAQLFNRISLAEPDYVLLTFTLMVEVIIIVGVLGNVYCRAWGKRWFWLIIHALLGMTLSCLIALSIATVNFSYSVSLEPVVATILSLGALIPAQYHLFHYVYSKGHLWR